MIGCFHLFDWHDQFDSALIQDPHAITDLKCGRDVVGYEDGCHSSFLEREDVVQEATGVDGIESRCRFIKEDDLRLEDDRTSESGAFLHAAGKLVGQKLICTLHVDHFEQLVHFFPDLGSGEGGVGPKGVGEVFLNTQGVEKGPVLEDIADLGANLEQLPFRQGDEVPPFKKNLTFIRMLESDDGA